MLNTLHHTAKTLFRVSLLHSVETFICMHAQEVLISNNIYKKACDVFLNAHKKLFSLQNVMKKIV